MSTIMKWWCIVAVFLVNSQASASNGRLDLIIAEASPQVVALLLNKPIQDIDTISSKQYEIKNVGIAGRTGKIRLTYSDNRLLTVLWTADSVSYSSAEEKKKDYERYVTSLIEIYGEPTNGIDASIDPRWMWDRGYLYTLNLSSEALWLVWLPRWPED